MADDIVRVHSHLSYAESSLGEGQLIQMLKRNA